MNATRTISAIATEIKADWKNVYFGAVPYLDAMLQLSTMDQNFGCDPAKEIVMYFLANANAWRGPKAREVKAELKNMLKRAT